MADLMQIGIDVRTNIKQATADLDKMGGSVVNNINTINRLESEVAQLNRELGRGRVNEAAYAKGMQQINSELALFQQRAAKAAEVEQKFGRAAAGGGKSLNRFNMTLQQGGYQLQDFIVQLQGGTSFFTAFSQQGSQFASIFGPQGAVIGAVIAIGSAIGGSLVASLSGASEATEDLHKELKALFDYLDQNQQSTSELLELSLSGPLEKARLDAIAVLNIFKQIDAEASRQKIAEGVLPIIQQLADVQDIIEGKRTQRSLFRTGRLDFVLPEEQREQLRGFEQQIARINEMFAKAATGPVEGLGVKLNEAFLELEKTGFLTDKLKEDFRTLMEETGLQVQVNKQIAAEKEKQVTVQKKLQQIQTDAMAMEAELAEEKIAFDAKTTAAAAASENKLRLVREKANIAALSFIKRRRDEAILALGDEADVLISNANLSIDLDKEYNDRKKQNMLNTMNYQFSLVQGTLDQLADEQDALNEAAEELGVRLGIGYARAIEIIRDAKKEAQVGLDAFGGAGDFKYSFPSTYKPDDPKPEEILTNIQDTIDALREQTKHETKLLSLTGERLKEEEIYYDLVLKNKDADIKLSDKKLRAIAKEIAAQQEANEMYEEAIQFVDGISDAFSDFVATGLRDFKSFVSSIKDMFVRLLADMAAAAVRNRILIPITTGVMASAGSAAAGTAMGQYAAGGAQAGTFAATLATGAKAFGTGFGSVFGAGGIGLGGSFQALGSLGSSIGSGTFMSTLGAAAPALLAVAAVVGLLTKKTKLLDSGLRATVEGFDVAIETFKLTQSSRLFGLLKGSKVTSYEAADAELADPLIKAIGDMQQSIVDAAGTLGIGADAFDNFSYQFKLSLKGLTEEEQLQKINEEITKMGDSFASLSGHFETMNELLAVAQQRYDLETRLLQLQGNEAELLIRQRERETAATHELNQALLAQIYAVEDAQIAANKAVQAANAAFATVQRSIQARKDTITRSFDEIMETIQNRIEAANENVSVSRGILSSLEGASSARVGMTRGVGLAYLRELRGASRITDQKMLDEALEAVADPSQGLYTNFVDYQRDFADQSNLIRELEEKAGYQLDTDEQTLLQLQEEAAAAQSRYEAQIDKLDEQLAAAQNQMNALLGIDTSVKSVEAAIADLSAAVLAAVEAQAAAKAAAARASQVRAGTGAAAGVQQANAAGQQILNQLGQSGIAERKSDGAKFQKVDIRGSAQLLQVASDLGVKTSGKTGAQIQQAISNAGNLGVNMDNATRALQFAMGGNFGGGLRMVGERGPELEATGPSRIFSTKQTAELFRNPELVAEVRSLREEVAGLRSESRQLQASNSKYVKRNYDINRKWDTEGLPATRT